MTKRKKDYPWEKKYPTGIKWDCEIPAKPLFSIFDESAEKYPENICIDYYGRKYSYAEISTLVNKMAKGLQHNGVVKGTKIGLFMPNCPLFVIAYYAILKIGGVVVNYNPLYTNSELTHQVADSGTTIMITLNLNLLFKKAANLLQATPLEKVIIADFKEFLPFPKNMLFGWFKKDEIASVAYNMVNISAEELMDNDGKYKKVEIDPKEDIAVLQYTGGTTGTPKSAVLTHYNLYANAVQCGMWFEGLEEGNERMIGILPFFHVFAMTVVMNLSILKACQIIMYSKFEVGLMLKDIQRKKGTLLPGVPTLFSAINNHRNIDSYNLESLKFCMAGGAPLPVDVKQKFESLSNCTLIEGYGLSETSPVAVANPLFGENREGSIGIPFPATIVEIRDPHGRHSLKQKNEIGEICIIGPQVMKEYYNNEKETEGVIKGKRLHTGDLGYIDKDGYVFVVDRLKEMIICSGFNVYPREIEEEIYKHHSVKEAAVIGIDDEHRGQVIKAFVALRAGESLSEQQLKDFLSGKLAKYKQPAEIEFRESLPKTMIGKIAKKELLKKE